MWMDFAHTSVQPRDLRGTKQVVGLSPVRRLSFRLHHGIRALSLFRQAFSVSAVSGEVHEAELKQIRQLLHSAVTLLSK